jgi:hypothetical protein
MKRTKGQASLEFLMTYGWAIIVIAVVLVAIWQWGIFNPQGKVKATTTGFWGVAPLDFQYNAQTGDMVFSLQNTVTDGNINITEINVTISDKTKYRFKPLAGSEPRILSGETYTWNLPQSQSLLPKGSPGDSFALQIVIEYIDDRVGSDTKLRSSGTIQGSMESTA